MSTFAAALACAAQLSGLAMPAPSFPITWIDERPDPVWCAYGGYVELAHGVGCLAVTAGGRAGVTVRAPAGDWRVLVIEGCRVLAAANGLMQYGEAGSDPAARETQRQWCYAIGDRADQCPR